MRDDILAQALALHRSGALEPAERAYRGLLAQAPDDGEVLGLLAMVAFQTGDAEGAKALWRRAIAAPAPVRARLRDLNNLLITLMEEGAYAEARALAAAPLPAWPADRAPDGRERSTLFSLATTFATLGRHADALPAIEGAMGHFADDGAAHELLGLLLLSADRVEEARAALGRAEQLCPGPPSIPLLTALSACGQRRGQTAEAWHEARRACRAAPAYLAEAGPKERPTILVLNPAPPALAAPTSPFGLHFAGNFPSLLPELFADDFRFASVLVDLDADLEAAEAAAAGLPPPALVINNITTGESLSDATTRAALSRLAHRFGAPVINGPDPVAATTRQRMAVALADVDGARVMPMLRFANSRRQGAALVAAIEAAAPYPLIVRDPFQQIGYGMVKVDDRNALRATLSAMAETQFYVTPFVENRGPDGLYRKVRAVVVDTDIVVARAEYDTSWNVHGRLRPERQAYYLANRHLLDREIAITRDPEGLLGARALATLAAIRARVPLDMFGIDFDVLPDGRVLFFEANASMYLLDMTSPFAPPELRYPVEAEMRLRDLFRRALHRRIAGPPDGATGAGQHAAGPARR